MTPTRTITIVCGLSGTGLFHVHEGERYATHLCWDEMLAEIAQLTHPQIKSSRYGMDTPEGHVERDRLSRERMQHNRDTDVRGMQRHALEEIVRWNVRRGEGDKPLPLHEQLPEIQQAITALRLTKPEPEWMPS